MFQKNILASLFVWVIMLAPFAYAANEKVQLTTYFPIPYGQYTNLKSTGNSYFVTSSGNVGIGIDPVWTDLPNTGAKAKLEVAQNNAIKIGQAYLSSGGNYARFAINEWHNGTTWTGIAGMCLELTGAAAYMKGLDGSGGNATWSTVINSTTGWTPNCSEAFKQNIHALTMADYALLRGQFQAIDLFSYNRKDVPTEPEVGFIIEYAPDLVLDKTKTRLPLIKAIGYLAAVLKAQENVLIPLEKEVQALKREVLIFGVRQKQIEVLQKDVEGLRKKLKSLKEKNGKA